MKYSTILLVLGILAIGACTNNPPALPSTSKIGEVSGNDLRAEMYMFPGPNFVKQGDEINLKFVVSYLEKQSIDGKISVEDTPDNSQFGGIQEPAELDFHFDFLNNPLKTTQEIIVPGATGITYKNDLENTIFLATINYGKNKVINSGKFCLKYSTKNDVKNCNFRGNIGTNGDNVIRGIEYEYGDKNGDDIVDTMALTFDLNERCDITTGDDALIKDSEVYLLEGGVYFDCRIDYEDAATKKINDLNHKKIKCSINDNLNLNPRTPSYDEFVVAKFKYDCKLSLKSGFIDLNKGG